VVAVLDPLVCLLKKLKQVFDYITTFFIFKFYFTGDGVTFSLASALALWSVGVVVHFIRNFPTFYFLPMIGGMFFAMANAKMVPILKTIGLGLGTSIRASIGIIVGWADARFGIFGSVNRNILYFEIL
jgi:hypothetical protein